MSEASGTFGIHSNFEIEIKISLAYSSNYQEIKLVNLRCTDLPKINRKRYWKESATQVVKLLKINFLRNFSALFF